MKKTKKNKERLKADGMSKVTSTTYITIISDLLLILIIQDVQFLQFCIQSFLLHILEALNTSSTILEIVSL